MQRLRELVDSDDPAVAELARLVNVAGNLDPRPGAQDRVRAVIDAHTQLPGPWWRKRMLVALVLMCSVTAAVAGVSHLIDHWAAEPAASHEPPRSPAPRPDAPEPAPTPRLVPAAPPASVPPRLAPAAPPASVPPTPSPSGASNPRRHAATTSRLAPAVSPASVPPTPSPSGAPNPRRHAATTSRLTLAVPPTSVLPIPEKPIALGASLATAPRDSLEVIEAQGTDPLSDVEQDEQERTYGPVIASGTDAGRPWSLRGRIGARGAATMLQTSTGGGGSSGGALPFEDLGWKKLGHFGSVGSGEIHGQGAPRTRTLKGVVSKQTAAIDVRLADGTSLPARIIDTGDERASFFVAVWSTPSRWEALIARDATGAELETYRRP